MTARRVGHGHGAHPVRDLRLGHPQRRVRAMFLAVSFVLSLFAVQLLRLQAVDASALASEASAGRTLTVVTPAVRGSIVDAHGVPFATTVERWNVLVNQREVADWYSLVPNPERPGHLRKQHNGIDEAVALLSPALGMGPGDLREKLSGRRGGAVVANGVTPEVWRAVEALDVGGISGERTTRREHPAGGLAVPVTGWFTADGQAIGGVEHKLDDRLTGRDGSTEYQRDPSGRQITSAAVTSRAAAPGRTVQLTLDRDLQWKAEQALAEQVKASGALSGTAVVMRVKDGALLALANAPLFDPEGSSAQRAANLHDRAFEEIYEPGSTGKVMTAAAVLEEGVVTPETPFSVPGQLRRADKTFHDSHAHGTERLTFAGVLAKSSNIGTILAGEQLPAATMHDYLSRFGVGQKSGLGIASEARGILAPVERWSGSQRYTVLFGQGLSVNAVQAAGVYQTLANGGVRQPPRLVGALGGADGVLHPTPVARGTRVVSTATASALTSMLEGVVSAEGTAPQARIPGYRVAGKTGTAQRAVGKGYSGYTASFIGFAPADAPQLVVAVTLQRPVRGHFGGTLAAPVFRDIMSTALQSLRIPPTGATSPSIRLVPDGG